MNSPSGLSYSAISTWEQCRYKYMRMYDGGEEGKLERAHSATAVEGSLVHDTLELWHKDRTRDWRDLLKKVAREKEEAFSKEKQYAAMISTQYTSAYSLLSEYMKRTDIYPKVLDTEISFNFILPNGVPVRGRIDRVDDLGNGHISLVDYKTTRTYIWKNEVENSLQGMMYVLVAKNFLFKDAKRFSFTIDALRFSPITVEFTNEQLSAALDYLEIVFDTISSTDTDKCDPRLNKFCGYCQISDSCPAFQSMLKNGMNDTVKDFEGGRLNRKPEEIIEDFLLYSELEQCGKKGKQQSETMLDGILQQTDSREGIWGNHKVYYANTRYGNPKLTIDRIGVEK